MPVSQTVDAIHIAVRDHRILRDPEAAVDAPERPPLACSRWSGSRPTPVSVDCPEPHDRETGHCRHRPGARGWPRQSSSASGSDRWSSSPSIGQGCGSRSIPGRPRRQPHEGGTAARLRRPTCAEAFLESPVSLLEVEPSYELLLDDYTSYRDRPERTSRPRSSPRDGVPSH